MKPDSQNWRRDFWRDRRVFVTGATGLVGSWLMRRLIEADADVVCLVRDWVPQSELMQSRLIDKVSVVRGQRPVIRSDGSFVRDYFYVEDGAAAYMFLAEQLARRPEPASEAYTLSTELQLSVVEIDERVLQVMGSTLTPQIMGGTCHEIPLQYLCARKAREELGSEPLFSLEERLRRTIVWYLNYLQPTVAPPRNSTPFPAEYAARSA